MLFMLVTSFLSLCMFQGTKAQLIDRGAVYFAENSNFELNCENKTEGIFAQLAWTSNAYTAKSKITIYSYSASTVEYTNGRFIDRVTRLNETSIRITGAKVEDSGEYECNIIYKYAPSKDRIKVLAVYNVVIVSSPYVITVQNQLLSVSQGEDRSVYCEVQGLSPFNITWIKVDSNMTSHVQFDEEESLVEKHYIKRRFMRLRNISAEDTGRYKCIAHNLGGRIFKQVHVKLKTKPKIISKYQFFIDVDQNGELKCEATGYPVISFTWKFMIDSEPLVLGPLDKYNDHYFVLHTVYDTKLERGSSILRLENVKKSDFKTYTCIAENKVGSVSERILLDGLGPPDAPTIIQSKTEAYTDKIKLYWVYGYNGGRRITAITIQYRNSTNKNWTKIQIYQQDINIMSYVVTNLQDGTKYKFRLLATNSMGGSEYSKTIQLSTKNKEITATPTNDQQLFGNLNMTSIIGIFAGTLIALIVVCILTCIFIKKLQKSDPNDLTNHNSNSYGGAMSLHTQVDGNQLEMEALLTPADEWEFPRDRLTITTVLGQGAFGIVLRGLAQGIKGSIGQVNVAVKMVRDNNNDAGTKDLLAELNLLKLIPKHNNVVGLLGSCTRNEPLYVIVEYCSNGDLQGFLRSSRGIYERYYKTSYGGAVPDLTSKMLLKFAWQITKGMAHLAAMKVIHRDLAARNILVDDQLVCKISDFGFARDIYVEDHYLKISAGGRFPIKWMAIESLLDRISTTKSDVWAFGVVLWELVTLGASPYPGMNSYEVVSFLQDGYRMDKPKHCSEELYGIMMKCWNVAPGRRPTFNQLSDTCQDMVESSSTTEYISMSYYQDNLYINFDINGSMQSAASPRNSLSRSRKNSTMTHHSIRDVNLIQNLPPVPPVRTMSSLSYQNVNNVDQPMNRGKCSSKNNIANTQNGLGKPRISSNGRSHSVTALSERSATGASLHSSNNDKISLLRPS